VLEGGPHVTTYGLECTWFRVWVGACGWVPLNERRKTVTGA